MRRVLAGMLFVFLSGVLVAFDAPEAMLPQASPEQLGRLGMAVLPLARQAARTFKLEPGGGAVVVSVERFGPAGRAGVRTGDIIVSINGIHVSDGRELARMTVTARTGSIALIEFVRNGERQLAALTVGRPPPNRIYVELEETPRGTLRRT